MGCPMFSQLPSATGMFSQMPRHERKHPPYTFPPPFKSAEKKSFLKYKNTFILTGNRALLEEKKTASLFLGVHDLDESAAAEVEKSPLDRVGRWLWRWRRGKVALRRRKKKDAILIFIARDQHLPQKIKQCFLF